MEALPAWRRLVYCGGSAGFSTLDNLFGAWLVYFLLPPIESGLPQLVSNETLFLGLTATGLIVLFGRVVDAVADPLIAHWSDNSRSPWGRRRFFLLTGALPFALACALLFTPPDLSATTANAVYVGLVLGVYFFFYTYYVTPYLALIPELTRGHADRLRMTALQAALLIVGAVLSLIVLPALRTPLAAAHGETWGFRLAAFIVAGIGLALMWAVGLAVDERRFVAPSPPSGEGLWTSLRETVADRKFLIYVVTLICYWFCFMMFRPVIPYLPEVLLGREPAFQMLLMAVLFGGAALFFVAMGALARRLSNKTLMLAGLASFALLSGLSYFLGDLGEHRATLALGLMFFLGFPVAVLLVVPNAIVSDISEVKTFETGRKREAMYFGAQGFLQKANYGLSVVVLAYLFAQFGKDMAQPLGVQLAGPVGAVFAAFGFVVFLKFPQAEMDSVLDRARDVSTRETDLG